MGFRSFTVQCCGLLAVLALSRPLQAQPPVVQGQRLITVSGQGESSTAPDRARLHMGVTLVKPDVAAATAEVDRVARAAVAAARGLGLADADISSAAAAIQPEYVWDEQTRSQRLTGYRVSRDIELRIADLSRLGEHLQRASAAGINQLQPPVLESTRASEVERQALAAAALDAQAKAALLARTLGARLGPLHTLNATEAGAPVPLAKHMVMSARVADNEDAGISTGLIRFEAQVIAEFELLDP